METVEGKWLEDMDSILSIVKKKKTMTGPCMVCWESSAIIRCKECQQQMCNLCDQAVHHNSPLHNRQSFSKGFFQPLSPCEILNENQEITEEGMYIQLIQNTPFFSKS